MTYVPNLDAVEKEELKLSKRFDFYRMIGLSIISFLFAFVFWFAFTVLTPLIPPEQLAEITTQNRMVFFGLPLVGMQLFWLVFLGGEGLLVLPANIISFLVLIS